MVVITGWRFPVSVSPVKKLLIEQDITGKHTSLSNDYNNF